MVDLRGGRQVCYHCTIAVPAIPNLTHTNESKEIPQGIKWQKITEMSPQADLHTYTPSLLEKL